MAINMEAMTAKFRDDIGQLREFLNRNQDLLGEGALRIDEEANRDDINDYIHVRDNLIKFSATVVTLSNNYNNLITFYEKNKGAPRFVKTRIIKFVNELNLAKDGCTHLQESVKKINDIHKRLISKGMAREFCIEKTLEIYNYLLQHSDNYQDTEEESRKLEFFEEFNHLRSNAKACETLVEASNEKFQEVLEYIKNMSPIIEVYRKSLKNQQLQITNTSDFKGSKSQEVYESCGGGGGKASAAEIIDHESIVNESEDVAASHSEITPLVLNELVNTAFYGEGKKQYRNLSRVSRWDVGNLTAAKIKRNHKQFGDYSKRDEVYLNQQIIAHSGKGVDRLLNNPTLQQQFCEPIESGYLIRCILKIKGDQGRHLTGSFLLRCNEKSEIFHRGFQRELWGAKFDHLLQINVSNKEGGSKEGERPPEEEGFEDVSDLRVKVFEDGNLHIELKNHSLIEGYAILRRVLQ